MLVRTGSVVEVRELWIEDGRFACFCGHISNPHFISRDSLDVGFIHVGMNKTKGYRASKTHFQ
jgi:hypothetical protein